MADETRVVYDDFSGGEYGHVGGANAPDNSFTGRNVTVYRTGLIGPRAGIKELAFTPGAGEFSNMWRVIADGADTSVGLGSTPDAWYVKASGSVYKKSASGTFNIGTITAPTRAPQAVHLGLGKYVLTNFLDATYIVNLNDNTITPITGAPGCTTVAIYSDRIFLANNGTSGGYKRVFYTEVGAYTTLPGANYFDVGSRAGVAAMLAQRDHLAIATEDGSWWVFRGAGSSASVRKITAADWPHWSFNPHAVANLTDDIILEMTPLGDWPATFDGTRIDHYYPAGPVGDSTPYTGTTGIRIMAGRRPQEALIIRPDATNGALGYVQRDGIWTLHTFPTDISYVGSATGTGQFTICKLGEAGVEEGAFYEYDMNLDRPAFTNDTHARPGDLSDDPNDSYFYLPEWWSKPGTEVRVRQVIVDFIKYNTGSTSNNLLTVELTCFGMFENDGTEAPASQSWEEDGSVAAAAGTAGVRDRRTFNFGEQGYGAGFQVVMAEVAGIAIRCITVVLDTQPSTPRF